MLTLIWLAFFSRNLIVGEIAGTWEMKPDINALLLETENKFDKHMRQKTGINPSLMMSGNYARTIFLYKKIKKLYVH